MRIAVRVAHLDAPRVAQRLLDEEVGDDGRRGVGGEVDGLDGRLGLLPLERLREAGDRAAERRDGARGVVAVGTAEARGGDEEGAGRAERAVERAGRGVEVLDADAERLAERREVEAAQVPLGVERREPEEACHGAARGPLGQALGERLGRGAVLERQDVDAAGVQPLDEGLGRAATVEHHRDAGPRLERDARRPAGREGRPEDRHDDPPRDPRGRLEAAGCGSRNGGGDGRRGGTGRRGGGAAGEVGPAVEDESDDVGEGRVVAQLAIVVARDSPLLAHRGEELGLLDRVDAEVRLEVELRVEHLRRVARLLGDDRKDPRQDNVRGGGRWGRGRDGGRGDDRGRRGRRARDDRSGRTGLRQVGPAVVDELDDVTEGRVVAQLAVVVARDPPLLAHRGEELGLLDRVDAEVRLEVELRVEHLGRVARLVGDDRQDPRQDRVGSGGRSGGRGRGRHGRGRDGRRRRRGRNRRDRGRGLRRGLRQVGPAVVDELDDAAERRVVPQLAAVVARDSPLLAHGREELGLLHRVDAEVRLEVELRVEHLGRVARLVGDDRQDPRQDWIGQGRGRSRDGYGGDGCGGSRGRGSRHGEVGPAVADELDDEGEGRVVAQLAVVVPRDAPLLAHGREELGLLDGIDAEVGLEVEVEGEHLRGVAGLLGDDGEDAGLDGVLRRSRGRRRCGRRRNRDRSRRLDDRDGPRRRGRSPDRRGRRGRRGVEALGGLRRSALVLHAEVSLLDLGHRGVVAADRGEPGAEPGRVVDPVGEAELLGRVAPPVRRGDALHEGHADLRAEARAEAQGEVAVVAAPLREVERPELRVDLPEVRDRRDEARLEHLHADDVLDPRGHRVPGEALRVRHDDAVGRSPEGAPEGEDFRRGAAAAGRGVGLVRDEDGLRRDRVALDSPLALRGRDERLHDLRDVVHVEARAVEGAVAADRGEESRDRGDSPLAGRFGALDDEGRSAHPDDHAVAAAVERKRRVLHLLVEGGRARGDEPGTDPLHHVVRSGVVGRDHEDPAAAAGADPVLGEPGREPHRGAGGVDLGVRPTRADELGELRVPHREDPEEEAAVEDVGLLREELLQRRDLRVDLGEGLGRGPLRRERRPERLELGEARVSLVVDVVALQALGERVVAGEGRREDDPGVVLERFGQRPALVELRPLRRRLVAHDEGDPRVAQRVEAHADGEPGGDVEGRDPFVRDAELRREVELPAAAGELDDVGRGGDLLEAALAVLALDEADDVLGRHRLEDPVREAADELVAAQDRRDVVVVEDPRTAREAERGARDDDRLLRGGREERRRRNRLSPVDLHPLLEELGEEEAEVADRVAGAAGGEGRHGDAGGNGRGGRGGDRSGRVRRPRNRSRDGARGRGELDGARPLLRERGADARRPRSRRSPG